MARIKSSLDMSDTFPRTSADEGSTMSKDYADIDQTIYRESFSVFGSDPFAADETVLDEQGGIFQLLDQFVARANYLCIFYERAVRFICLNHFVRLFCPDDCYRCLIYISPLSRSRMIRSDWGEAARMR